MTRGLTIAAILFGAGLVCVAYSNAALFWLAGILVLLIVFWLIAFLRGWNWVHTPGLYLVFGFAAAGLFLDLPSALLFPGAFLALVGWNLADFDARLRLAGPQSDVSGLSRRHLRRLASVLGIGAAAVLLALALKLKISLGWMAALAILSAWGLGRVAQYLLRKE